MYKSSVFLALLSASLFGAATPASKYLLSELTPFQLAGLLYLGAAIAVSPTVLKKSRLGLPQRADYKNQLRLAGAILFGGILGPVALLFGLLVAEATSVSLWLNMEMAATAVLGVILFRDHLGVRGWLGVIVALVASILIAWAPGTTGLVSGGLVLLACILWGMDNHLTALIDGITPGQSTFWKGIVAGLVNLAIGASLNPVAAGAGVIIVALIVGALSYGASIALYIRSAQVMGATRAQVIFASAPFFGVVLAVVFLGETISIAHAVALPLFVLGVALLFMESHNHIHTHDAITHEHVHRHDDGHHTHMHGGSKPSLQHSHVHTHEPVTHKHPHWPDLHHRHSHHVKA
jgi:drug/metabolite transporter (DMT)-like permease